MTLRELRIQIMIRLKERNVPEDEWGAIASFTTTEEMTEAILDYLDGEPMETRMRTVVTEISKIQLDYEGIEY